MSVIGIVSEYNPFHLGHLYHINESCRRIGEGSTVVCVMSGDFVQRGEAAMYSKFARAEAACLNSADLVVELPLPWCLAGAERFARGAVAILGALGVSHLSFGSECGDAVLLRSLAEELRREEIYDEIKNMMKARCELSFAAARELALKNRVGDSAFLLSSPNNILAVEYLKAIYELGLDMDTMTVRRIGSGHDKKGESSVRSASELRELISAGGDMNGFIPEAALSVYSRERMRGRELSDRSYLETALLSRLRMLPQEAYFNLPDADEGLCRRIYAAVRSELSLAAIFNAAKTKRYTHARIRRLCLSAALGLNAELAQGLPPYARVLAANERGREQLRKISESSTVPVLTKSADVRQISQKAQRVFEAGAAAHDLYVLSYGPKYTINCGEDWCYGPIIVKNS